MSISIEDNNFVSKLPEVDGKIFYGKRLADISWMRVGGEAKVFFKPKNVDDLRYFLSKLSPDYEVFPLGVGSNLIVRDGGINGVVIKLGRNFSNIEIDDDFVVAGAGALDSRVAEKAAENGIDLSFLRTIPGTIGGAVKMNAGCYGTSISDVLVSTDVILRSGKIQTYHTKDLNFSYRTSILPEESIVVSAKLKGNKIPSQQIISKMRNNQARRSETQPTKEKTCGSTFKNPFAVLNGKDQMSTDQIKAWHLIDKVGLKGFSIGGAEVSTLHSNFLINTGSATADDVESLGEYIQKKVFEETSVKLEWEVKRVGVRIRTEKENRLTQ